MLAVGTLSLSNKEKILPLSVVQGGREVSDFISYLKREATNPLVVPEDAKKKKKKDDDKLEL